MDRKNAPPSSPVATPSEHLSLTLTAFGNVRRKKMFGGYGIFENDAMFALAISEGDIFLKVSDANRQRFLHAESKKFGRMPYDSLPDEILADDAFLKDRAAASIEVAHQSRAERRK